MAVLKLAHIPAPPPLGTHQLQATEVAHVAFVLKEEHSVEDALPQVKTPGGKRCESANVTHVLGTAAHLQNAQVAFDKHRNSSP